MKFVSSFIKKMVHLLLMKVSPVYAKEFISNECLTTLREEIELYEDNPADTELLSFFVLKLVANDPSRMREAVSIIAASNNFDCMRLAIKLDIKSGKVCADKLMEVARRHLTLCGHADRASWARKRLLLAKEWYEISGTLTNQLEVEITDCLKKVEWIIR